MFTSIRDKQVGCVGETKRDILMSKHNNNNDNDTLSIQDMVGGSVTRLGDLLNFRQLFKVFGNN